MKKQLEGALTPEGAKVIEKKIKVPRKEQINNKLKR